MPHYTTGSGYLSQPDIPFEEKAREVKTAAVEKAEDIKRAVEKTLE